MHEAVKQWASARLTTCFIEDYEGLVNEDGSWQMPNGKFVKWEIKETKVPDAGTLAFSTAGTLGFSTAGSLRFSTTVAFALAGALKRDPILLAEELSQKLTETAPRAWSFSPLKGYINAYFQPSSLSDYGFDGIKGIENTLEDMVGGEYALYRLKVLKRSLVAKKVVPLPLEAELSNACIQRFSSLFLMPTTPLDWQKWVIQVEKMTADGKLVDIDAHMLSALLAFLAQI
jgi:hypothetical protein